MSNIYGNYVVLDGKVILEKGKSWYKYFNEVMGGKDISLVSDLILILRSFYFYLM